MEGIPTRPRLLAAAIVASLALATSHVSVAPAASAQMSAPVWSTGDYWVFSSSGSGGIGGFPAGILRFDVVGTDTITVGSSTFSAYHTKVNLTFSQTSGGTTTTIYVPGDAWFRTSDLSLAKISLSASLFGISFSITIVYNPPPTIQWPLTANASWAIQSTVTTTTISGSLTQTNSTIQSGTDSVLADTSLVVAAGSFTTTPLKQTISGSTGYTVDYWSSAAGFWVSERNFDAFGTQTGSMDLTSYSYSPQGGALDVAVILLIVVVIAAVAVVAAVVLLRRKRPPTPMPMQPGAPGYPPAQPPQMPPQGPPPQPPAPPTQP